MCVQKMCITRPDNEICLLALSLENIQTHRKILNANNTFKVPKYHYCTEHLQLLRFHKKILKSTLLQIFSALKNYQGILLTNVDNNSQYFHNCENKNLFFGTEYADTICFAPLTHSGDTCYSSRAILSIFRIFQHFDKVPVNLSLSRLKFSNIVHKEFLSPDTPTFLSYPIQSMQRRHFCQRRKTSLQLAANGPSH